MDIDMFDGLTAEQINASSKLRKLRTSTQLVQLITKFNTYEVTSD